ncbi:MAG: sugar phosphate isomerase/epimerase [Phycisphaerales bacterium]|nr:sugar phosphate isomerase/epimerase [Phycisphaerales bacterium]
MVDYGVSPAFIVSLYGPRFSINDFCNGLSIARRLGFDFYQPEIFHKDQLEAWQNGGAEIINQAGSGLGLKASQFVAHFMHVYFASPKIIQSDAGLELLRQTTGWVHQFDGCKVLTIPTLPLEESDSIRSSEQYDEMQKYLFDKIIACLEIVENTGLKLAFEIVPFSVIGNIDRFLAICEAIGSAELGLNLDTGHAWATRDCVHLLPLKIRNRIFGLHLKDNDSNHNQPLAPGRGTIQWKFFLENLAKIGYLGSLDIEIGCEPERVSDEYSNGLNYLKGISQ